MNCRFCNSNTKEILDIGPQPLANSLLDSSDERESIYPLKLYLCEQCGLVQVPQIVVPEEIFGEHYSYHSSIGGSYVKQCREFVNGIIEWQKLKKTDPVLELACNDGYLLKEFKKKGFSCIGIEPSGTAKIAEDNGLYVIKDFFSEELAAQLKKQKLIIANNVLAHVPNLNSFIRGLKKCLMEDGIITIEVPDLKNLLHKNQFDTIYHEHFSYFSIETLVKIFAHHWLHIFNVEHIPSHGGSLRLYLRHGDRKEIPYNAPYDFSKLRKETLEHKIEILSKLSYLKRSNKKIAGFGAAAKAAVRLNYCGIKTDFIDFIVDETPYKIGKFMPGSRIPIVDMEYLKREKPDVVMVLPWNFREEIENKLSFIQEWGGEFI